MGDSTAETSNLLSPLKELGLMHYLIAVTEQTATREYMQVFAGINVAGIKFLISLRIIQMKRN